MEDLDARGVADAVWLAQLMAQHTVHVSLEKQIHQTKLDDFGFSASEDEAQPVAPAPDLPQPERAKDAAPRTPVRPPMPPSGTGAGAGQGGASARVGALRTLPDGAGFRAALRAFRSKPRRASGLFDEAATVEQFAANGMALLTPVMQPGARRWLSLSLMVETTASNALWSQPIDELEFLARHQGVFRQVRRWTLTGGPDGGLSLAGRHGHVGRRHLDPAKVRFSRDELVIVVSDFTSENWWSGRFADAVGRLADSQPLLLLQTLPERLWNRSWVGIPDAQTYAPAMACASAALHAAPDARHAELATYRNGLALPLAEMTAASFGNWCRTLMHAGVGKMPAIFLAPRAAEAALEQTEALALAPQGAQALLMAFNMASSPLARRLAKFMAVTAPLTFPAMRWVQEAMLPQSDGSHLAEFFLGGLLQQVGGDASTSPDDVVYDFAEGVREALQVGIPINHAIEVLHTVGAYLEAHQSGTVDARTGICTWPAGPAAAGSPALQAFAMVSRDFLARIGLTPSDDTPAENSAVPTQRRVRVPELAPSDQLKETTRQAEHSRRLRQRVRDLQFSLTEDGVLAILHDGGVQVWDVLQDKRGFEIGSADQSKKWSKAPQVVIYWIDSGGDSNATEPRAPVKEILALFAASLAAAGCSPVVIAAAGPGHSLPGGWPPPAHHGALIVFENAPQAGRSDPADISDWLDGTAETYTSYGAIRMSPSAPETRGGAIRGDLSPFGPSGHILAPDSVAASVGRFVQDMVQDVLYKASLSASNLSGATAISWLGNGSLAIAESRGNRCVINEIDAREALKLRQARIGSRRLLMAVEHGRVARLVCGQGKASPTRGFALAWIDDNGALWIDGRQRVAGNGLPRLVASADAAHLALTTYGLSLRLIKGLSNDEAPQLVPLRARASSSGKLDELSHFLDESIVAISAHEEWVCAVTSSGYLHRGQASGPDETSATSGASHALDQAPIDLAGKVACACFSADGASVVILKQDGTLELRNTEHGSLLSKLMLSATDGELSRPVLAISPGQQLVAVADGKRLEVFRVALGSEGGSFAALPDSGQAHVLWVDDRPENNHYSLARFKKAGLRFTLAKNTATALDLLNRYKFAAVISDMGRKEGPREGYVLLDAMRGDGDLTPFFIYAGSNAVAHRLEAESHGAQGSTNDDADLLQMVLEVTRPKDPAGRSPSGSPKSSRKK